MDMYVDSPEFIDLFEFVVMLGADKNTHIRQLLEFGSVFVDQKQRAFRLQAFAVANQLPLSAPRCKLAILMRAYRKAPTRTWCPTPEPAWARATRHREREREREGVRDRDEKSQTEADRATQADK